MGKGHSGGSGAHDYYGTIAGLVCAGPVDELVTIIVDGKTVWHGPIQPEDPGVTNPQAVAVEGFGTAVIYWREGQSFRSALADLAACYDGWFRWNKMAAIDAGRFLHGGAPPAFTPATTIDFHDAVEELTWEATGYAPTVNEVLVRFRDRDRAFKDNAARR